MGWSMMGAGPQHRGELAEHLPVSTPRVRWRLKLGDRGLGSPLVADDVILCSVVRSASAVLVAVRKDIGKEMWSIPYEVMPACYWSCGAILEEAHQVVCFDDENVRLVDLGSGRAVMEERLTSGRFATSPPAIVAGKILVGAGNRVMCLDGERLEELWTFDFPRDRAVLSPPVLAEDGIILQAVNNMGTQIVRLDFGRGVEEWRASLQRVSRGVASVLEDRLFVVTTGAKRELSAFSTKAGELLWSVFLSEGPPNHGLGDNEIGIAAEGHTVYAATERGLCAFSIQDGESIWLSGAIPAGNSAPSIGGGTGYVTVPSGELVAWDLLSGEVRWLIRVDGAMTSTPSLGNRGVSVLTEEGELVQIENE